MPYNSIIVNVTKYLLVHVISSVTLKFCPDNSSNPDLIFLKEVLFVSKLPICLYYFKLQTWDNKFFGNSWHLQRIYLLLFVLQPLHRRRHDLGFSSIPNRLLSCKRHQFERDFPRRCCSGRWCCARWDVLGWLQNCCQRRGSQVQQIKWRGKRDVAANGYFRAMPEAGDPRNSVQVARKDGWHCNLRWR